MKVAIILFNLGGPDSLDAVQPFLRNLFGDPAILRLPTADPIAAGALPVQPSHGKGARDLRQDRRLVAHPGPDRSAGAGAGRSVGPGRRSGNEWRGYVCMRYWHPMTEAVVRSVKRFAPDRIVLLPLYPQFSTTTTASSFKEWNDTARFTVPTKTIESYPTEPGFIAASVELVRQGLAEAGAGPRRVLFSAHGLPERVIKAGDPYQTQVEQTAKAIAAGLGEVDWSICYQSRVGPLKWIGPSTDAEIRRAGADKVGGSGLSAGLRVGAFRDPGRARHRLPPSCRGSRHPHLRPRAHRRHASLVHRRTREAGARCSMRS